MKKKERIAELEKKVAFLKGRIDAIEKRLAPPKQDTRVYGLDHYPFGWPYPKATKTTC